MRTKPNNETVVLITGASNGIGLAAAERFATEGYIVIATARLPESRPNLLALAERYKNIFIRKLDVTDSEENINALIHSIGMIDILINNAGIGIVGVAESFSQKQIQRIIDTNVYGVVNVTNAVLLLMRKHNSGLIITISSIVGPLPDMRQCFYSGSKAMIEHYTAQLKNDLRDAGYDITVANIHPGPVVTNFESSAQVGERFDGKENPYPQMHADVSKWRALMREGRPVSETVDTIFSVVCAENAAFWNPTEPRVYANFAETYSDPTGERFSKGPSFSPKPQEFPFEMTMLGSSKQTGSTIAREIALRKSLSKLEEGDPQNNDLKQDAIMKTATTYHSKKVGQIIVESESNFITIYTSRLILRSLNQHDREEFIAHTMRLMGSPENTALFGDGQVWDEKKVIESVDLAIKEWNGNSRFGAFSVHDAKTNEFMGNLSVDYNPSEFFTIFGKHKNAAEIGYILDHKYWGKGYGTEIAIAGKKYIKHMIATHGFETIENPLEEIVATAHPENHGSTSILRKTLKRQEDIVITRYGHPRIFFYKPLNKIKADTSTAVYAGELMANTADCEHACMV